jgi:hypothetical protein
LLAILRPVVLLLPRRPTPAASFAILRPVVIFIPRLATTTALATVPLVTSKGA